MNSWWKVLEEDFDYEIMSEYPHYIRRVGCSDVLKFTVNAQTGYYVVNLNGKTYQLHRIIANNFIPNPEEKPYVGQKSLVAKNYEKYSKSRNFSESKPLKVI